MAINSWSRQLMEAQPIASAFRQNSLFDRATTVCQSACWRPRYGGFLPYLLPYPVSLPSAAENPHGGRASACRARIP
ncbi:hypothetical protein L209DRAFT_391025 [Thermothelomyces heterothallicus CBS 203.75]